MVGLNRLSSIIMCFFIAAASAKAQQLNSNLLGKWTSLKPYYNTTMEIIFKKDSSYTEITRDCQNRNVQSVYKSKFKIVNDSVIIIRRKLNRDTYCICRFSNATTLKFFPYKKELQESIPFFYLFTFKKAARKTN